MFCVNFSFKTLRVMCLHHGSLDVERVSVIRFIGRLQFKHVCVIFSAWSEHVNHQLLTFIPQRQKCNLLLCRRNASEITVQGVITLSEWDHVRLHVFKY